MTKKYKKMFAWICFAAMLIGMNGYAAEPEQPEENQNTEKVKIVIAPDEEKDVTALESEDVIGMKFILENISESDISPTIVVTSTAEEKAVKLIELAANEKLAAVRELEEHLEADVALLKAHEKLELQVNCMITNELAGKDIELEVHAEDDKDVICGAAKLDLRVKALTEEEEPEVQEEPETPEQPEILEEPKDPEATQDPESSEQQEDPEIPEEPETPEVLDLDVKVETENDLKAVKRGEKFAVKITVTNPNQTDLMNVFISADLAKDEDGNEFLDIGNITISDKLRIKDRAFEIGEIRSGEQVVLTYEAVIPKDLKETNLYFIYHVSSWDFENDKPFAQKGGLELLTLAPEAPDTSEEDEKREEELKQQEEELKKQQEEAKRREEELKKQQEEAKRREEELKKQEEEAKKREEELKKKEEELKKKAAEELKKEEEAKKKAAEIKKKATTPHTGDPTNITALLLCMLLAIAVIVSCRKKNFR